MIGIGLFILITTYFIARYIYFKKKYIKIYAECLKCYDLTHGCKGEFYYTIEGKRYSSLEAKAHIRWLIGGCEYSLYVCKKNPEKCISGRAINEILFFCILNYILMIALVVVQLYIFWNK